ncbi:MAG: hypothetical protein HYY41_05475 [Chloroflexi bacterium]|nr:hypothetical protein [Chloroflexota bacterium]
MNKKFSRILGVGLSLMMLASLITLATPASAGTLSVSAESSYPKTEDNILGPAGVDVVSLAVSGSTMYAATAISPTNTTHKPTNAGASWSSLNASTDYPTTLSISLVAVAADDANIVAMVANDGAVYYSSTGGASWSNLLIPATGATVTSIDISPAVSGVRYVAAGGTTTGGAAELWTIKLAMAENWQPRYNSTTGNATASQTVVAAVKFSPKFATDKIITVISGNSTAGAPVYFQAFRHETGAYTWNKEISFLTADWGTGIAIQSKFEVWTGTIAAASIALMDTFSGTNEGDRIAFVAVAGTAGGGAVRVVDSFAKKLETWSSGDEGPIGSLAYDKSGKLLAGDYDEAKVYVSLAPMATDPRFERINTLKQPGGTSNTRVAWSGTTAVAGTSGDESAFAVSTDSGNSWNDISLIDTTVTNFADVAVNSDGSRVYLTTYDTTATTNDVSLWSKTGTTWTRVFSKRDLATANADFMVRVAPENIEAVYIASKGTNNIWVSKNGGKSSWTEIPVYKLSSVVDLIAQTADIVHAVSASQYSKTIDAGASWGTEVGLDGLVAKNINLATNNDILVGGTDYIAFSKDAGASFTRAVTSPGSGTVFIVADKDYATNNNVYVGVGTSVKRGKAQQATQTWSSRGPTVATTDVVVGMDRVGTVIYVLTGSATTSALHRALNLTPTVDSSDLALWSNKTPSSALGAAAAPQALKTSPTFKDGPKLWFVNTNSTDSLVSMFDPIALVGPTLTSPADKIEVAVNPDTGKAYNVTFVWSRYADSAITKMQLQIAADSAFSGIVSDITFSGIDSNSIAKVVGPTGAVTTVTTTVTETTATYTYTSTDNAGGITTIVVPATTTTVPGTTTISQVAEFNPGSTYYWRVRVAVDGPLYSPFSAARSFTIAPPLPFAITSPVKGAVGVSTLPTIVWTADKTATGGFEIAVSEDLTFAILDWSHTVARGATFYQTVASDGLRYGTTYYVRVRAVTGTKTTDRGPWQTSIFTTEAKPVEPTPPVVITPTPPTPPPQIVTVQVPVPGPAQPIPSYLLWMIIGIGAVLIIALIVLIVRTRRVA